MNPDQPTSDPSQQRSTTKAKPGRPGAATLAAVALGVLALITGILWVTAKGAVADRDAQVARLSTDLSAAQSSVSSYSAASSSASAAAAEVPDLKAIADKYFTNITGDEDSVRVKIGASSMNELESTLVDMLDELGFSSATLDRMQATRALDGTLTAEGRNCNVSWTYHPDSGLTMIFETAR